MPAPESKNHRRSVVLPRPLAAACLLVVLTACGGPSPVSDLEPAIGDMAEVHHEVRLRLLDDYERWQGPFRLGLGRRGASVVVPAEVGWCYAYFAVGDDGVRDLDMHVTDPDGRSLGSDTMFDDTPFVQHCADRSERVTVRIAVSRGSGDASFSVLRKPD